MAGGRNEVNLRGHALLCNHILRFISSMSLKCALELDIAQAIRHHGGPISLPDLASALSLPHAKVPALRRIMRAMASSGIFDVSTDGEGGGGEAGKYTLNATSWLLTRDEGDLRSNTASAKPFALIDPNHVLIGPWHDLAAWFRNGDSVRSPFEQFHKADLWGMAGADPEFNRVFNDAMAWDSQFLMAAMVSQPECREALSSVRTLVDVGGGTGAASKAIADAFPGVKCTVLDLPHVVAEAVETDMVKFVAGDMFKFVPSGDAILLKWILHDWSDEDCVKILTNCREASLMNDGGGKVILVDMILNNVNNDNLLVENQYFSDMLMMILTSGKERTEKEWSTLFKLAGFSRYKIITTLGVRSVVEIYP